MSSVECLREFVIERLSAAAEEIFSVFKTTIVEYEEEIDRQRKLLDIVWKPEIKLHRIVPPDIPQQHVCKEEEVPADQPLCDQERSSSLDQEEPEPPQIKEEEEELCTSQEGEQPVLKQEADTCMLTPTFEESDHKEPELENDQQLLSNSHVAESQDQQGSKHGDSGSTRNTEPEQQSKSHSNNVSVPNLSDIYPNTLTRKRSSKCDTCGKAFKHKSKLKEHMRRHTGEKPYYCNTCDKRFGYASTLTSHMKIHTGEKPHVCKTCGKAFRISSGLRRHMRTHTGEKPYLCNICGKRFCQNIDLKRHKRTHTREKPYTCNTCGKHYTCSSMTKHMRVHHSEKPYTCKICGKEFRQRSVLTVHIRRAHTGERPYLCKMCGKRYFYKAHLTRHLQSHTGK